MTVKAFHFSLMRRKATHSTSRRRTTTTWSIRRRGRLSSVWFSSRYLSTKLRTCRSCYHWYFFLSVWRSLADSPANQLSIDGRIFSIGKVWGLTWKEPGGVLVSVSYGGYYQDEWSVVYRAKDEPISFLLNIWDTARSRSFLSGEYVQFQQTAISQLHSRISKKCSYSSTQCCTLSPKEFVYLSLARPSSVLFRNLGLLLIWDTRQQHFASNMIVFHHQSTELTLKNKWLYRVQLFFFLSAIGRLTDWPLILYNNSIILTPRQVFDLSHGPCPQSGLVLLGTGVLLECLIFEGVWYANKVPISISVSSDISRGLVNHVCF